MVRTHIAVSVAALTLAAATTLGVGEASAVETFPIDHGRTTVVVLTHPETVLAARLGVATVLTRMVGDDRWGATLAAGSRFHSDDYSRVGRAGMVDTVSGQQLVVEAAAHPDGFVALGVSPDDPLYPLWVQQVW